MRNTNKKGFTIVELVIVVAVIAILAAVLIPTFSSIIKKANLSADQQAVRQMNVALAAEEAFTNPSIFSLYAALDELGMSAKDYKPLTKDTMFFWDAKLNCILHVDADMKVLAPAEHVDKTYDPANDTWISLSMELFEENVKAPAVAGEGYTDHKVSGYNGANVNVKVTTAGELAFVFNYLNEELAKDSNALPSEYVIDLGGNTIDMMGASLCIENLTGGGSGWNKSFSIKNGTIKNVSLVDPTSLGNGQTEGHTGQYKAGFIAKILGNTSVTIENMTFDGIHVNNSHVSQAGLLIGFANGKGTVTINNVTIKNSSLLAHRSAGALIGNVASGSTKTFTLTNITMTNVDVKTVGGRSAMLIGYFQPTVTENNLKASGIKLTNCSFSLYECTQNTGTSPVDNTTVLSCPKNGGTVKSWVFKSDGVSKENTEYIYVPNALMLLQDQVDGSSHFDGAVTGWNK